jgi:hypothetical protein
MRCEVLMVLATLHAFWPFAFCALHAHAHFLVCKRTPYQRGRALCYFQNSHTRLCGCKTHATHQVAVSSPAANETWRTGEVFVIPVDASVFPPDGPAAEWTVGTPVLHSDVPTVAILNVLRPYAHFGRAGYVHFILHIFYPFANTIFRSSLHII